MGIKVGVKSLLWTSREVGMDAERFEKGGECDLTKNTLYQILKKIH